MASPTSFIASSTSTARLCARTAANLRYGLRRSRSGGTKRRKVTSGRRQSAVASAAAANASGKPGLAEFTWKAWLESARLVRQNANVRTQVNARILVLVGLVACPSIAWAHDVELFVVTVGLLGGVIG